MVDFGVFPDPQIPLLSAAIAAEVRDVDSKDLNPVTQGGLCQLEVLCGRGLISACQTQSLADQASLGVRQEILEVNRPIWYCRPVRGEGGARPSHRIGKPIRLDGIRGLQRHSALDGILQFSHITGP